MKKIWKTKKIVVLLSALALLLMSVGGTIAYLQYRTNSVENHFSNGDINITVDEPEDEYDDIRDGFVVKHVRIKNDSLNGKLPVRDAYVRAKLVVTWVDDDGTVLPFDESNLKFLMGESAASKCDVCKEGAIDEGIDYALGKWDSSNGYYYYTKLVKKDQTTHFLIHGVEPKDDSVKFPETGHLEINVLVDAVQGNEAAVKDAWGNDAWSIVRPK